MLKPMWNSFNPSNGQWYRWRLNGAEIYLRKDGEEWRSVFLPIRYEDLAPIADGPELASPPTDAPVSFVIARGNRVALRPSPPRRPFLIDVGNSIRLMLGSEAYFQIDLPIEARLETENGDCVGEGLPFILTNAWFGDKLSGVLCYYLRQNLDPYSRGERKENGESARLFRSLARCKLRIRNGTKGAIDLKHIAVYTDLLPVYDSGDGLVTSDILVDSLSDGGLKMSVQTESARGPLLAAARVTQSELLVKRGVNFLRELTGI